MGMVRGAGRGYTWGWYNLSGYGKGGDKMNAYSVWLYFSGKSGPAPSPHRMPLQYLFSGRVVL